MAYSAKFTAVEVDQMIMFVKNKPIFRTTKAVKSESKDQEAEETAKDQGYSEIIRKKVLAKYKVRLAIKDGYNIGKLTTTVYANCCCSVKARFNLSCATSTIQKAQGLTFTITRPTKGAACSCCKF